MTKKPRKTYTAEEKLQAIENLKTRGRKGVKMPRINLAYTVDNHEYIRLMAGAQGKTMTQFINEIIEQHREQHKEIFEKLKQINDEI